MMNNCDLLIVGAGPAGMAAAKTASALGLSITVVDEQARSGGQFLRQPPSQFSVTNWLPGKTYQAAKDLVVHASQLQAVNWQMQSTVSGIFPTHSASSSDPRFRVMIDSEQGSQQCLARSVIIAGGCYDLPVIFPGWNTPGVMAAGGIQAFIKSQQFLPGQRFVLAGSHPLQLIIAEQILQAGGEVAAVLFAQKPSDAIKLLNHPSLLWNQAGKFGQMASILLRLRQAGVPVKFNHAVTQALGQDELTGVSIARVDAQGQILKDTSSRIDCDRLGVCFSFLASSELVRQLEADCHWQARRGGWIAKHDKWMASSIAGLFVAGEVTGVAGSDVAMQEGQLAALGCALEMNRLEAGQAEKQAIPIRARLKQLNGFAELLSQLSWPGDHFFDQLMSDDATVCKCEELSAGHLRRLFADHPHIRTASAAKLLSRAGMGLCQGRYCHYGLTRLLAQLRGADEQELVGFTSRFPSKPISIGHLVDADSPLQPK